ncbi:hypothetical protein [Cellulomonas sp. P5_C5]
MTDLGQLLAATETAVARARTDAAPPPDALTGTLRRVRRRRAVRHSAESVAGVALVGVLGATAWLTTHPTSPPAPASTILPTASSTPTPTAVAPAVPAVHVATPLPVPAGLIESATAGWMLANDFQVRAGVDPYKATDDDYRTWLVLVSPTGERHPLLEIVSDRVGVGTYSWTAGQPLVVATTSDASVKNSQPTVGLLDLRTGDLTPWPDVPTSASWIGAGRDESTVWSSLRLWADSDYPEGFTTPLEGAPEAHLLVRAADGTQRDLGPIGDSREETSVSPDGTWVSTTTPDGALLLVDLRSGAREPVTSAPADRACTVGGWSGPHELLLSCGVPADLLGIDATKPSSPPRQVGTSEHTVVDATLLGDGRVGVGILTQEAPCNVGGDPAVLADGAVTPLTGQWGPFDHAYGVHFGGGAVVTDLNGCYVGHGKAGRQRVVRTDVTTGAVVELALLQGEVTDDGFDRWLHGWLVGR